MTNWRLLVIEDDKRIADLVRSAAEEVGFQTAWASGPQEIMHSYVELRPQVIVLDVLMPDMDGLEVLQFLREQLSQTKIIILSGSEANSRRITESMGTALGLEVIANISKPFRIALLKQTLEDARENFEKNHANSGQNRAGGAAS